MSGLDQLKYQLISIWIGQYWFGSVNIGLDQVISVWIGYYQSTSVNISLGGLNAKKY